MTQAVSADRCHVIENWCAAHDRPAGHVPPRDLEPLRHATQVLLVRGRCAICASEVARQIQAVGDYVAIGPWLHEDGALDSLHVVASVASVSAA